MSDEQTKAAAEECAHAALAMCEKVGYPTSDELLCLIVKDTFFAGVAYRDESVRNLVEATENLLGNYPGGIPDPNSIWSECVADAAQALSKFKGEK